MWWRNPFILVPSLVAIVVAIIGAAIPLVLNTDETLPEIVNILSQAEVMPGEQITITGNNLDLVSEVLLVQGAESFPMPILQINSAQLLIVVPNVLPSGVYTVHIKTESGDVVATERTVTVRSVIAGLLTPTPIVIPVPPTPTATLKPTPTIKPTPTVTLTPTPEPFAVTIDDPADGSQVSLELAVKGTTNRPVPDGRPLWIVVEFGKEWWPQQASIIPFPKSGSNDLSWTVQAFIGVENDQGKVFNLIAILTTPSIDQRFSDWFEGPEFPGFLKADLIQEGAEILTGISVTRR